MSRPARLVLIGVGALIALIIIVVAAVPLFLNTDSFRTRIENTLTESLGRKVTIGKLDLSVWSGGLVAENATVADDPRFSTAPFIQAASVKIGVEMLPLIFHKQVVIEGISMQSPKIQLLRAADGTWNYSTIGSAASKQGTQTAEQKEAFPNLTVGEVNIANGQITVGAGPGVSGTTNRVYEQVNLAVKDFAFTKAFPFTASANLPAGGSVSLKGNAGPINAADASATPFSGNLEIKHLDPLAAGFVEASDGITGTVDSLVLDASWSGTQMHVSKLIVDTPKLTVVRTNAPKQPKPADTNAEGSSMLNNLSVDDAQIKNGTLTLATAGQTGTAVYSQLNAQLTNVSSKSSSPFTVSGQLPNGGSLSANGNVGPFNQANNASTPLDGQITLKHFEIGTAGILPPDAGIAGMADLQAKVQSNGQTLNANGTVQVAGIKLAKDGVPSAKPVQLQFTLTQNEQAMTGEVQQAVLTVGSAVVNLSGTYQTSGPSTAINLKVVGNGVSINELEAFLPALGVHLPQGSRLQGGTVTTALAVTGSTAAPIISGPVKLNNTQLAGFDLGSKLSALSKFTGGRIGTATGPGTTIRSLSMNVREEGGAIRTDNIALDVAGVGTATGAGSVSAGGALNYNVVLKLTGLTAGAPASSGSQASAGGAAGLVGALSGFIPGGAAGAGGLGALAGGVLKAGIPVAIGGTTSNPTFSPNIAGLATGVGASAAKGLLNGQKGTNGPQANPLGNALGGLLGRH
ncbi:AsmA family protein [Granulicella sp. L60]|uniref:AsmA family protein n=1 Tax=Granulicella sp. L60 TaxID=1641866 RepID=UPI00131E091D|nr:AsmA family protein [Granulicella sp. L60]